MWQCHSSHGYDNVIMPVTIVSILFLWFLLISDEILYEISYIRNIISLYFCAYVEYKKWSPNAILETVLVWMWSCHSSHGHWWCQQYPWLRWKIIATDALTSAMSVATILGAADVNNDRGYYQYCDGPKYTCGYNDLPSHCYCAFL
jgi:hypothetical protein